jgi:hypothetical protein
MQLMIELLKISFKELKLVNERIKMLWDSK